MRRDCLKCGATFNAPRSSYRYCDDCRFTTCTECGARFRKHQGPGRPAPFCSLLCRSAFRFRGQRVEVPCSRCGVAMSVPAHRLLKKTGTVFCGRDCRTRYFWSDPAARAKIVASLKASPACHSQARRTQLDAARSRFAPTEAWRAKIRDARMRQRFPAKMTRIEQVLHDAFVAAGVVFAMHRTMFGRWQPDFVFDEARVVVQADGDYWHSRPAAVENDARFDAAAAADGWLVLRFRGSRIARDLDGCVRETLDAIEQRRSHRTALPA